MFMHVIFVLTFLLLFVFSFVSSKIFLLFFLEFNNCFCKFDKNKNKILLKKTLLDKSGKCTVEVKGIRALVSEIFKTLNKLNPAFIEEIFHRTTKNTWTRKYKSKYS